MPPLHCPLRLRGHRHYSTSLSRCHTGSTPSPLSVPARWPVWVGWSRQTAWEHLSLSLWAVLSTGQILMTLSTVQAVCKHPNHLSRKESACVCVCKGQQQSAFRGHQQNPKRPPAEAEIPSHHLHTRGKRIIAHLIFAFRVWSSLTQAAANLLE